jgi:hypothetical protein
MSLERDTSLENESVLSTKFTENIILSGVSYDLNDA